MPKPSVKQLEQSLKELRWGLRCCGPVVVKYEPGCMWARCDGCGLKVVVPDWQPREVWRLWKGFDLGW